MIQPIQILLADDHPCVRVGIRTVLSAEPDMVIVGEAIDGHSAQQLSQELQPDVLLLDIRMAGPSPAATISFTRQHCPMTKILVLTAHDDDCYVRTLLRAGIAGYVLKDEALGVVIGAIRTVIRGGTWFSPAIIARAVAGPPEPERIDTGLSPTERELQVLRLVARGWTNLQIAGTLGVTERTVRFHLEHLFARLGVSNRAQAVHMAQNQGWLDNKE